MDAKLKADWIAALRSGDFQQAREVMRDENEGGYCCLGVLCVVGGADFGEYPDEDFEDGVQSNVAAVAGRLVSDSSNELTRYGRKLFGLSEIHEAELISRNDGRRVNDPTHPEHIRTHSFSEIADYIEANIPADEHSVAE